MEMWRRKIFSEYLKLYKNALRLEASKSTHCKRTFDLESARTL